MKKIAILLMSMFAITMLSCSKKQASTDSGGKGYSASEIVFPEVVKGYDNLLDKAKEYKDAKKYFYAAGYYYDASECSDITEEQKIYAESEFKNIYNSLKNGELGLDEKNEFGVHDAQEKLKWEGYQYFTEFCPWNFIFSGLNQKKIDYETRTADYTFYLKCRYSEKYKKLSSMLRDAFTALDYSKTYERFDIKDFDPTNTKLTFNNKQIHDGVAFLCLKFDELTFFGKQNIVSTMGAFDFDVEGDSFNYATYEVEPPFIEYVDFNQGGPLLFLDLSFLNSEGEVINSIKGFCCYANNVINYNYVDSRYTTFFENGTMPRYTDDFDFNGWQHAIKGIPSKYMNYFDNKEISVRIDSIRVPYGLLENSSFNKIRLMKKISIPVRDNFVECHWSEKLTPY